MELRDALARTKRVKAVWNLDHIKRGVTLKQTVTDVLRRRRRFIRHNMAKSLIGWLECESWACGGQMFCEAFRTDRIDQRKGKLLDCGHNDSKNVTEGPELQQMVLVTRLKGASGL